LNNEIIALEFLNRGFLSQWYKSDICAKMDYVDIYWRIYRKNQFLKVISAKEEKLRNIYRKKNQINRFTENEYNRLKSLI